MNNSQMLTTTIVFCLSANAGAAALNNQASGVYTDGKVEFRLPENSIPLDKQKCERDAVAQVPASLPSFKCEKVQHNSKEYLILKNTEPKGKQKWQFKIFTIGNQVTELGDLNAEYSVVPVLVDSKRLEFLAVNIDTWSQWKKEDRKVSYERYKVGESGAPSLTPIKSSGVVAKNAMPNSEYLNRSAADPSTKGSNKATKDSDSGATESSKKRWEEYVRAMQKSAIECKKIDRELDNTSAGYDRSSRNPAHRQIPPKEKRQCWQNFMQNYWVLMSNDVFRNDFKKACIYGDCKDFLKNF